MHPRGPKACHTIKRPKQLNCHAYPLNKTVSRDWPLAIPPVAFNSGAHVIWVAPLRFDKLLLVLATCEHSSCQGPSKSALCVMKVAHQSSFGLHPGSCCACRVAHHGNRKTAKRQPQRPKGRLAAQHEHQSSP